MKISFCLITLNEEDNLPRCLRSCASLADEIVVVDSGSTDGTQQVANEFGARWCLHSWQGYVAQKNHALDLATHPWVFSLDADEALSPELRAEIVSLKRKPPPPAICGFHMPRCVWYEGRWIRHGDWYPDRLVRLFRRDRARFVGRSVHERLEIRGPTKRLKGDLHHFSFRDREDHWRRCQTYARLWAEDQAALGRVAGSWTGRLRGGFRWFRGYILRAGFLDGPAGWHIACLCAREVFLKYRILRALSHGHDPSPND